VQVNGLKLVRAVDSETPSEIAYSCGIDLEDLLSFNEGRYTQNEALAHGTPIFLEEKKGAWTATELEFYYSHEGKSFFEIGQLFGIQSASLRRMNGATHQQEPALKAKVRLRGIRMANEKMAVATQKITSPAPQKPRNKKPPMAPIQSDFPINSRNMAWLNEVLDSPVYYTPSAVSASAQTAVKTRGQAQAPPPANVPVLVFPDEERTVVSIVFHMVEKGDTLMGLSRKYGITVPELRKLNSMASDNLSIGQRIRVK
jgi:LysM repeat protein